MDFLALRYAVYNAAHTLTHGFTYKSVIGAILAVLLHKHAVLLWFLPRWYFWTASLAG